MKKASVFALFSLLLPIIVYSQTQFGWQRVLNTRGISIALNPLDDNIIYSTLGKTFVVSRNSGETWESRFTSLPSDMVNNIAVSYADTSLIIIYSEGNLLRSTNGGYNWDIVLNGVSMNGETIDFHPTHPDSVFYVDFLSATLWQSGDRGENWTERAIIDDLSAVCSFKINPHNPSEMLAGAAFSKVMISTNGGYDWEAIKEPSEEFTEVPKIVWDPINPGWAYGSVYNDPKYSFIRIGDNGNNWSHEGLYLIDTWALDIDPVKGDIYLGTFGEDRYPGFFKSYDLGKSWQRFGNTSINGNWNLKTASDSLVYAASVDPDAAGLYRLKINQQLGYLSGVVTDSVSASAVDYFEIDVNSTEDKMIASNKNGTYKLALFPGNYDITWSLGNVLKTKKNVLIESGMTNQMDIELFLNIKQLTLGGTVKGEQKEPVSSIVTLEYTKATSEDVIVSVFTNDEGYYQFDSLSSLNTYNKLIIEPLIIPYLGKETTNVNIDSLQNFSLEYADVIIANESGNPNFSGIYHLALEKNNLTSISVNSLSHPQHIAPNIVALTKKNTLIWLVNIDPQSQQTFTLNKMQFLASEGSHLIMSGQNLLENNDSHNFFSQLGISHAANYEIIGFADPMSGFDGNSIGENLSLTIRLTNQDSPDMLSISGDGLNKTFYYGSHPSDTANIAGINVNNTGNEGKALILGFDLHYQSPNLISEILRRSIDYFDGVINSVDDLPYNIETFELAQNYPNPFNPITMISYQLPVISDVELTVYNLLGQRVTTLVDKKLTAGNYKEKWDASSFASGVYIYQLKAKSQQQKALFTKKMVLIR